MKLLVEGYFTLSFHHTAYSVNVYLQPSATAARFTRLSQDEIEQGSGPAFDCVFLKKPGRKGAASGSGSAKKAAEKAKGTATSRVTSTSVPHATPGSSNGTRAKRKRSVSSISTRSTDDLGANYEDFDDMQGFVVSDSDEESEDEDWHGGLRSSKVNGSSSIAQSRAKRLKTSDAGSGLSKPVSRIGRTIRDEDVIELSD